MFLKVPCEPMRRTRSAAQLAIREQPIVDQFDQFVLDFMNENYKEALDQQCKFPFDETHRCAFKQIVQEEEKFVIIESKNKPQDGCRLKAYKDLLANEQKHAKIKIKEKNEKIMRNISKNET